MRQHNYQDNRQCEEKEEEKVRKEAYDPHPRSLPCNRSGMRSKSRRNDDLVWHRLEPSFLQYARLVRGCMFRQGSIGIDRKDLGAVGATRAFDLLVLEDVGHLFHVLEVETSHLSLFSEKSDLYNKSGLKEVRDGRK